MAPSEAAVDVLPSFCPELQVRAYKMLQSTYDETLSPTAGKRPPRRASQLEDDVDAGPMFIEDLIWKSSADAKRSISMAFRMSTAEGLVKRESGFRRDSFEDVHQDPVMPFAVAKEEPPSEANGSSSVQGLFRFARRNSSSMGRGVPPLYPGALAK